MTGYQADEVRGKDFFAQFLPVEVKKRIAEIPGVADVKVDVVWEPPWDRDRMSDAAKLQLGLF